MLLNIITVVISISIIISSIMVLLSGNRIYSILYLIFIYINTSLLFMYLGVTILGLFYFSVYIGAVAVLFLFSIMILNIRSSFYDHNYMLYISILYILLLLLLWLYVFSINSSIYLYNDGFEYYYSINDVLRILGLLIFKNYEMILTCCGSILLISMMGAINLTNKKRGFFMKKQLYPLARTNNISYSYIY